MDLNSYSLRDLVDLRRQVEAEIRARHARDPEATEYHLRDLAREWGMAVADLMSGFAPETREKVYRDQGRYQHPFDPRLTWSGTGAKPGWIREWESSGHSLSELDVHRRL
jgi:DNA-binding protein H-NS